MLNVIPNGLKLKKSPQIGRKSEEFSRKWKQIIQNAETDLTRTLLEEYRIAEKSLQLDFWNTMITYLSQDKDLQSIISTLGEIRKNIVSVSETTKGTRVRKMNRLAEGKYEEDLEIALKKEFNFQSDLDLLMDAFDEKLESRTIDLEEINRVLTAGERETISNETPRNAIPVRTAGEASNIEYPVWNIEEQLPRDAGSSDIANCNISNDEILENQSIYLEEINRVLNAGERETISNELPWNAVPVQTVGESSNTGYTRPNIEEQWTTDAETPDVANSNIPNDRISGRFVNDKVINLSNKALSDSEISVLSKGLKFVVTPKELDQSQIKIDLENFGRRLRLKWHFRESEEFSEYPAFRPKSKFNPRNKDIAIEVYLSKLEEEIMNISANGSNFSNISREERAALNELKSDRSIVIKEADKGSGVVVWDREDYVKEANSQLGDRTVYEKLDGDPSERLQGIISDALETIKDRGDIDDSTLDYLMISNPGLGRFYLLPKMHKRLNGVPGRPVISNCGYFTENISEFLDYHLQPLAKTVTSYIKDTNHFLKKLSELGEIPEDAILCTVDVVGLYPNIPHGEGLEALRGALEHREDKTVSTESLTELARVVLKNNCFEFNGEFYQQRQGTAIGTKFAPSYAILFMAALEQKLLSDAKYKPWIWWRYIDDIFLIWRHGEDRLREFIDALNQAHHSIKFTAEWSKETVSFLDVRVVKEGKEIITDLFTKPTDTHQLLHHSSCHPGHTKRGIPYSQALRIRRICSEDQFFDKRVGELRGWLFNRGYKEGEVDQQIDKVRSLDRLELLDRQSKDQGDGRIPLVLTYHPALNRVYDILRDISNILLAGPEHKKLFQNKIFLSFRRAKNLKDKLVRAKLPNSDDGGLSVKGCYKCNDRKSCQICGLIKEGNSFENSDENRSFTIFSGRYNCNSENVVYLLQCECCRKKYVGSTKTKFRQRFNVYKPYFRSYARRRDQGTLDRGKIIPQANFFSHFFEAGHNGKFDVTIKIIDGAENVFSLRRKELFWQYRLGTFLPRGLNERAADVELDMFACGMA